MAERNREHLKIGEIRDERRDLHAALLSNLDGLLAASRSQLFQIARAMGNPPDVVEDIVQETLLEAMGHLDRITSCAGVDRWLKEICRNICRRYARARRVQRQHQTDIADAATLAMPQGDDPLAALDQQDLMQLVERALRYLPTPARTVVERCYLEDQPQREVAEQLGITIKALETRLIRARRQLRDVLHGALHDEATALDLLPSEPSWSWRETREWCHVCGRQRLRGIFEAMPDGRINLRLRCPVCSPREDIDRTYSGGFVPLDDCRTFKPAIKRLQRAVFPYLAEGLRHGEHRCPDCGRSIQVRLIASDKMSLHVRWHAYFVVEQCLCSYDSISGAAGIARYAHPVLTHFAAAHPRWVSEPDVLTDYQGQPAYRFTMVDHVSSARCTYFAHAQTLAILAVFVK